MTRKPSTPTDHVLLLDGPGMDRVLEVARGKYVFRVPITDGPGFHVYSRRREDSAVARFMRTDAR